MKLSYRPEIDGLRAIAVGAVILYHAQITILGYQPFRGGFIGVDIFFVISGYLITSIILKELITTGSFSFKHFYERRIRRILPVLLFVMLVSLPFAWIYLLPSSFEDFSKSIIYSLGFGSNFYFHYSGQQYGALSGLLKPFLHTWSLSVEEQFYILFPIFLIVTFKYFRKYLIHILILGFIISLGLADWGSRNYPSFNFYVLPSRGWELLAGSILAYFEVIFGHRSKNKTLNLILPIIGLFLIGHSILFFKDEMFHPSFYTLSPIIGVCLIIWFSSKNELITKILSTKLFVGIGLISYSLYLWHYPIFAFVRLIGFAEGVINKIIIGLIILILSIISYYLIEKPFRNKKYNFIKISKFVLISIIILFITNLTIILNGGFKQRFPDLIISSLKNNFENLKNNHGEICFNNKKNCYFNQESKKKVYLIGDSQMGSISTDLKKKLSLKNYSFNTFLRGGCYFFIGFDLVNSKNNKKSELCNNKYFEDIFNKLILEKNSIIILGGRLPLYLNDSKFFDNEKINSNAKWNKKYTPINKFDNLENSLLNTLQKLSVNNKIILIYPIPERKNINLYKLNKIFNLFSTQKKNLELNDIHSNYDAFILRSKSSYELLNKISNQNIYRIYPSNLVCNKQILSKCIFHFKKISYYSDGDHPSDHYSEMINDLIIKEIDKIELKSN
jgi:peptidoglycan/LPS O-acetylase OafA/YrhL|tara:strand:- start:184 stop:2205 length:2022 start_codon:yes stop_codon:yes gene_type:complete